MRNRVFAIGDTHFGHVKIITEYEPINRPYRTIEEHDRDLVLRWNAVVKPKDTVWHVGDVFFGKNGHYVLAALNGIKKLVMGNHDQYPIEVYHAYFSRILGSAQYNKCILTHIPVHPCQLERRYRMNIHGHMHSKRIINDPRYVCVSAERTGLAPVLLDDVINGRFHG